MLKVVGALARRVRTLPRGLMTALTWDRGTELAAHKRNTDGLLRQYSPKGVDLSAVSQAALGRIARQRNQRPRKT